MDIARNAAAATIFAALCMTASAQTDTNAPGISPAHPVAIQAWAAKPRTAPFIAPNRPHWKLSEILKAHAGQKNWSQLLVRDPGGLTARYIQMAANEKTTSMFFADSSIFWVVESGQIRFTIEGQEPFVASKGFIVQVPARLAFHMETVGDVPSLRFEVSHTRAAPMFPVSETSAQSKDRKYVRVAFTGAAPGYGAARPYLDYQKDIIAGGGKAPAGFVHDGETAANVIRGPGVPRPPDSDPGHFHDGTSEFWIVLEGHLSVQIEGAPFIDSAPDGDVIYAPAGRWHRTSFSGDGMSGRISIHPVATALNLLDPDHLGAQ